MPEPGTFAVSVGATATTLRVVHDTEPDAASGEPAHLHDLRFQVGEVRVGAAYGLSEKLAFEMEVPFRVTRSMIVYRQLDGTPFEPLDAGIHHRNETLRGISDPRVGGRTGWKLGPAAVTTFVGVTVPLGRIEPDPFALGDAGLPHQHVQFGTGTFNPFLDAAASGRIGPVGVRAHAGVFAPWYENEHGYQAGLRVGSGLEIQAPPMRGWTFGVRSDVAHEEPERWHGEIQQDGNLGRTDVLVGVTVSRRLGEYRLGADVNVPVFQRVRGGQLDYPGVVGLNLSRSFGPTGSE